MNQNGGIHKGGFAVLCHRNGGSELPGILNVLKTKMFLKISILCRLKSRKKLLYPSISSNTSLIPTLIPST